MYRTKCLKYPKRHYKDRNDRDMPTPDSNGSQRGLGTAYTDAEERYGRFNVPCKTGTSRLNAGNAERGSSQQQDSGTDGEEKAVLLVIRCCPSEPEPDQKCEGTT